MSGLTDFATKNEPSLIHVASNSDIINREKGLEKLRAAARIQLNPSVQSLSTHVSAVFEANKQYREREGIDDMMLNALAQRNSEYTSDEMAMILKQGGSKVFMGLTGLKCRAAEAWLHDVMISDREKSWSLRPTPQSDLPVDVQDAVVLQTMQTWMASQANPETAMKPEDNIKLASQLRTVAESAVQDEAERRAHRMEVKISDQLLDGKWKNAFEDFIYDLTTLKAGIVKGPIVKKRRLLAWKKAKFGGKTVPDVQFKTVLSYQRISPFDLYPSEGATEIDEGSLCEKVRYTRRSLLDLRKVKNYNADAINLILTNIGTEGIQVNTMSDDDRAAQELKGQRSNQKGWIEGIEFWGGVTGQMLLDYGTRYTPDGKAIEPYEEYEVNAIQINQQIIYLQFNPDPLYRRPYSKCGWAKVPGSFWYKGIPELMRDLQTICNGSIRALINNMGIASGPQVVISDTTALPTGEKVTQLYPWKIWQFTVKRAGQLKPIDFYQPKSNAKELLGVYDFFSKLADDFTGIPAYAYGNEQVAGAGRTASGLSMLMTSAARGLKKVIARIDTDIVASCIQRHYDWNMLYDPDESIKGDAQIQADGALAVIVREQMANQRIAFLQTVGALPLAQRIMGVKRFANLMRAASAVLQLPDNDVVPGKDELETLEVEMKQEAMQAQQLQMQEQQLKAAA